MWALNILSRGQSKNALIGIVERLNDPENMVRVEATLSIGVIGVSEMLPLIKRMSLDLSEEVGAAAKEILERDSF